MKHNKIENLIWIIFAIVGSIFVVIGIAVYFYNYRFFLELLYLSASQTDRFFYWEVFP